jgi:cell wall-associated NlpC family hydrolase
MRIFISCLFALAIFFGSVTIVAAEIKTDNPKQQGADKEIVATAMKYKGVHYKFGGTTPKGFDCSGFVMYVFDKNGKKLPRTAGKQFEKGRLVSFKELKPADVVFFSTTGKGASHCGIYVGKGKFIHASSSRGVMVSPLSDNYWKKRYLGARRMI